MSQVTNVKLGFFGSETLIPQKGCTISFNRVPIEKQERTASGKLKRQIIRRITNIDINYSPDISFTDYLFFYDLYESTVPLYCIYNDIDGTEKTIEVIFDLPDATIVEERFDENGDTDTDNSLINSIQIKLVEV